MTATTVTANNATTATTSKTGPRTLSLCEAFFYNIHITNMIRLQINYSLDFEIERVKNTLKKNSWLKKNNYKITLPSGVSSVENQKDFNHQKIKKLVSSKYLEKEYVNAAASLDNAWNALDVNSLKNLLSFFGSSLKEINVILTKYGTGGSYNPPETIIINITLRTSKNLTKTLFHEIIHLLIEPFILKYGVSHWDKEALVNMLQDHFFSDFAEKKYKKSERVTKAFTKYFPDLEKIISNLNNLEISS